MMDRSKSDTVNVKVLAFGLIAITFTFLAYTYFRNNSAVQGTNSVINAINKIRETLGSNNQTSQEGQIDDLAATDTRDDATSQVAGANDVSTQVWVATDYVKGDISSGTYTVKSGDTLWEIAEAVYGDGAQWGKILDANKSSVGFLPNGSHALIITGQTLTIP
jgi:nucleoid-associated protein YgaU